MYKIQRMWSVLPGESRKPLRGYRPSLSGRGQDSKKKTTTLGKDWRAISPKKRLAFLLDKTKARGLLFKVAKQKLICYFSFVLSHTLLLEALVSTILRLNLISSLKCRVTPANNLLLLLFILKKDNGGASWAVQ